MKILHSKIIGDRNPLLILHGFLGMGDNWKTYATKLSEDGFQVHLIDQRNHGRSFHSDDFSYKLMVEDLKNYIHHHNLKKVSLLGHSMGGKTAMLFAIENPNLVDKLIVADMAPKSYKAHHNEILRALNSVNFSAQNSRKLVDEQLAKYIPEFNIRQFLAKSLYWVEKGQLAFRFNIQSLTDNYTQIIEGLQSQVIFEGKTLFLKGEKSNYILEEDQLLIDAYFRNNQIKTITNAGHWLHSENPKDFYDELIIFLNNANRT